MAYLEQYIPNTEFQQNTTNSKPYRILSKEAGMKTMLLHIIKNHVTQATNSQLSLLKRAATILQNISLNFRQYKDTIFKGSITVDNENALLELQSQIKYLRQALVFM